jgi:hypothetical protein
MKHWSEFLPKPCPALRGQREEILANHAAIKRLAKQIHYIQEETIKLEMEMDKRVQSLFTPEELETACARDTIPTWTVEEEKYYFGLNQKQL